MKLIEFLQAFADGKTVECVPSLGDPVSCNTEDEVARAWLDPGVGVRIKPELIPVDLSVILGIGIDCEFSNGNGKWNISLLADIVTDVTCTTLGYVPSSSRGQVFGKCRPRMDHWHSWQGGECPLPDGLVFELILRDGTFGPGGPASTLTWEHHDESTDIIAFRIVGLSDGFFWPWDAS